MPISKRITDLKVRTAYALEMDRTYALGYLIEAGNALEATLHHVYDADFVTTMNIWIHVQNQIAELRCRENSISVGRL